MFSLAKPFFLFMHWSKQKIAYELNVELTEATFLCISKRVEDNVKQGYKGKKAFPPKQHYIEIWHGFKHKL